MNARLTIFVVLMLVSALCGCKANIENEARNLVVPMPLPGQVTIALTGTGEGLVSSGRINMHRQIIAPDGVLLDTWIINSRLTCDGADGQKQKVVRGCVIMLHPLECSKSWFLGHAEVLANCGWDVVLMDLRAHGRSGGQYITWGAREKFDVKCVMDNLVEESVVSDKIYAFGSSLGGMVAIQYASIEPRCMGVMVFAPPMSFREISRRILLMLSDEDYEASYSRAVEIADFDPDEASTVAAASRLHCPLILVHGLLDVVVPYQHAEAIVAAAPEPKMLITLPVDGHAAEIAREEWIAEKMGDLADGKLQQTGH